MSSTERPQLRWEPVARVCFAILGTLALLGCLLSLRNGWLTESTLMEGAGFHHIFPAGWPHLANQPMYFTFMSNALVALTGWTLALRPRASSALFHVLHLCGLVCIIITGVVFNLLLRSDDPMTPLQRFHDGVQHIATPILAPLFWLVFGPRGRVSWRRIGLASIIPIAWLVVTMIRGAILDWYPYGILDVPKLGYAGVSVWVVSILAFYFLVAGVLWWVDRGRAPRPR